MTEDDKQYLEVILSVESDATIKVVAGLEGDALVDIFFFSSRRRHTRSLCDWSSDVCSSDLSAECCLVASRHAWSDAHDSRSWSYHVPRRVPQQPRIDVGPQYSAHGEAEPAVR